MAEKQQSTRSPGGVRVRTRTRASAPADARARRRSGAGVDTPYPSPPPPAGVPVRAHEGGEVEEILRKTLAMPAEQRRELLDRLSLATSGRRAGEERDAELWSQAALEALNGALGASGAPAYGPALGRRLLGAPAAFRPVVEFMRSSGMSSSSAAERSSMYSLLAGLLVAECDRQCRRIGIPLSLRYLASAAPSVASVFDSSFPGYAASGLAGVVARRRSAS